MPPKLTRSPAPLLLALVALGHPQGAKSQAIFDWPIRSTPQPEAVLAGAGAVFWNPAGLALAAGADQEVWIAHVDGPDATGVGGMAAAGILDLPLGLRGGLGYWHLGIDDIPRTFDSPERELGEVEVAEDVGIVAISRNLGASTGFGASVRIVRGSVDGESRSEAEGEIGMYHRVSFPLEPRIGLSLRGLGQEVEVLGGVEIATPALASSRLPILVGYGILMDRGSPPTQHRFSLRGSWKEILHVGMGTSHLGKNNGWVPLWMVGADIGRYSFAVLRESLANDFGAIHFFRAAIRFPRSDDLRP